MVALAENAGLMPLAKTTFLASSAIVFLKERRGFVRVAMEMGVPLVPVFCFGQVFHNYINFESKLFIQMLKSLVQSMQTNSYKWWKVPGSPIPFKNPLYIVVGRPIEIEKNPEPTMEQVDRVHSQFVEALKDLFARHKAKARYTDLQLKIL
ncbi:Diacylglycerol O-acyltransferase [Vigna angularis]|uniref:Diacylglycerol O-acyltransferase n=1 Tax=Phaseolus angularis TaxID=3914 RepID=A0A8T0LFC6_PHAAN|nr:Diacylglycerol O-acyltransferase [Vigna angularis]